MFKPISVIKSSSHLATEKERHRLPGGFGLHTRKILNINGWRWSMQARDKQKIILIPSLETQCVSWSNGISLMSDRNLSKQQAIGCNVDLLARSRYTISIDQIVTYHLVDTWTHAIFYNVQAWFFTLNFEKECPTKNKWHSCHMCISSTAKDFQFIFCGCVYWILMTHIYVYSVLE